MNNFSFYSCTQILNDNKWMNDEKGEGELLATRSSSPIEFKSLEFDMNFLKKKLRFKPLG